MPVRYYGVFDDGNLIDAADFEALVPELTAHTMNASTFTNNLPNTSTFLDPADEAEQHVIVAHMGILNAQWFADDVSLDVTLARSIMYPIADNNKDHPSLLGYNLYDDATKAKNAKLKMAKEVFAERDPDHPASPMLVGGRPGFEVYDFVQPEMYLTYRNHFRIGRAACDMFDAALCKYWSEAVRENVQMKPQSDLFHLLLQAHMTASVPPNATNLRYPSLEEMSLLFWEGLGEEADGIYWFTRSTLPDQWEGLIDRPEAYEQAAALGEIFFALQPFLSAAERVPDRFRASGDHYVSTFRALTNTDRYCVVVAHRSASSGTVSVTSDWFGGTLRDVLTDDEYDLGESIPFAAGEGRCFVLDDFAAQTPPDVATNLIPNPGFETVSSGHPTGWSAPAGSFADTEVFHVAGGGTTSMRLEGSGSGVLRQVNLTVALQPSTRYVLSGWMKTENLDDSLVGIELYQLTPTGILMGPLSFAQTGDHDWRKLMTWFYTPADNTANQLRLVATLKDGETVWFDDFWCVPAFSYYPDEYLGERLLDAPEDAAPSIITSPQNRTITSGSRAQLSVVADGTPSLTYQWYEGESGDTAAPISGATSASYQTPALTATTRYWVRVENDAGEADSSVAVVTVTEAAETRYVFFITP